MQINSSVTINRPLQQVWDFYDNPQNMKLWLANLEKFELISGVAGMPGSKAKLTYLEKGRTIYMYETITERLPLQKVCLQLYMPKMLETSVETIFQDNGNNTTTLHCSSHAKFEMISLKVFGFLMKKAFQKRQDEDLNRLKTVMENTAQQ